MGQAWLDKAASRAEVERSEGEARAHALILQTTFNQQPPMCEERALRRRTLSWQQFEDLNSWDPSIPDAGRMPGNISESRPGAIPRRRSCR